jgi:hypothetical protein
MQGNDNDAALVFRPITERQIGGQELAVGNDFLFIAVKAAP